MVSQQGSSPLYPEEPTLALGALCSAVSTEDSIAFRQIHAPSGQPIRNLKGIITDQGFEEVPEAEIIKGYEHSKGQHVLIRPEEIYRYGALRRCGRDRQPLLAEALT